MRAIYYNTTNFIRHTGNVVDLEEYRRKLTLAQEAPLPSEAVSCEEGWENAPVRLAVRSRRSGQRQRRALLLDACASLSVVIMTLIFILRVLFI